MFRKLLLIILIVCCLPLIYFGTRMMLAGFWADQMNTFLTDWQQRGEQPADDAWQIAYEAATKAIELYPVENGEYYSGLGLVWQWKQYHNFFGDFEAKHSRQQALAAYRIAVIARPSWPYDWANLAFSKVRLLEFDNEYKAALHKAVELGPWRIGINKQVAEMGLISWPELDLATQEIVLEAIKRTVDYGPRDSKWLEKQAKRWQMMAIFCGSIDDELKLQRKICNKWGQSKIISL